jgi:hypothetical protein
VSLILKRLMHKDTLTVKYVPPVIKSLSQRTFSKRLSDFGQTYCNILWALSETIYERDNFPIKI